VVRRSHTGRARHSMKIFDTRWKGAHGIGRFATELHARLQHLAPIGIRGRPSSPLEPLRLTRYLYTATPTLFFSPGYNAPLGIPCPFVFCIHDLSHIFGEKNSNVLKRAYYASVTRPAARRARSILTVSEFSRRSICEWAQIDETKVINVGNGVSEAFTSVGPHFNSLGRPYFLQIGCQPHKNFERVLRAFAASGLTRDFIFVSTGNPAPHLREVIATLRLEDCVSFVGVIPEEELAALYRGATALIFVSLHEGFGLPIVEAMACGTPVVTASVTSMPEVAGDAAILVDPYDIEAIRESLTRLASDTRLRESLRARGLERAKLYSWSSTAGKVSATLLSCTT
jgi:O-antigen biosynthesis alpha-1,2-mannosyltransferase